MIPKHFTNWFRLLVPGIALLVSICALMILDIHRISDNSTSNQPSEIRSHLIQSCINRILQLQEAKLSSRKSIFPEIQSIFNSTVSAHKILHAPERDIRGPKCSEDYYEVVKFNDQDAGHQNEHARGVDVHKNGIFIKYTGEYYLYSSIQSKSSECSRVQEFNKEDSKYTGVLLRSVNTCTHDVGTTGDTVFTGGIFHLQEGDVIQVCVLDSQSVDFTESSYFGIFMLGFIKMPSLGYLTLSV